MAHSIQLSERTERLLSTLSAEQGISPDEYLRRFIEAWAAQLSDETRDPAQAWFWTPEWQAGERAADADTASGRSVRYDSDEAFLRALEDRVEDPVEG